MFQFYNVFSGVPIQVQCSKLGSYTVYDELGLILKIQPAKTMHKEFRFDILYLRVFDYKKLGKFGPSAKCLKFAVKD